MFQVFNSLTNIVVGEFEKEGEARTFKQLENMLMGIEMYECRQVEEKGTNKKALSKLQL